MINAIQIALSGLSAASKQVEASASNIANLQTEGSLEEGVATPPYSALTTQQSTQSGGVKSEFVQKDPAFVPAYDPDSPFANEKGEIGVPNVNLAEEAVNIQLASHIFKANLAVIAQASEMSDELLTLFDERV